MTAAPLGHPRSTERLIGQSRAERALLDAYRSGRLHHAVLLHGPRGIGKATLAYRLARFLLRHPDHRSQAVREAKDLSVPAADPIFRLVASLAHPDLTALELGSDGKDVIRVDRARSLGQLFESTASAGGWRVAIVDPAEGLNANASNALLKTLEEPPPRSLILLVSHAPGRIPVTLRSRAMRLALAALDHASLAAIVGASDADADVRTRLAEGSIAGYAALGEGQSIERYRRLIALLSALPRLDLEEVHALLDGFGGKEGKAAFRVFSELMLSAMENAIRLTAIGDVAAAPGQKPLPGKLARWVALWEKTARSIAQAETLNLDRKQALLPAFLEMADIARG